MSAAVTHRARSCDRNDVGMSQTISVVRGVADRYVFDDEKYTSTLSNMALLYTLPQGRPIWGVAYLGDELFVIRDSVRHIDVYRYKTLCRRLTVPSLCSGRDLAACCRYSCLYITDVGQRGEGRENQHPGYAIHRVPADDTTISTPTKWSVENRPWGVAISNRENCHVLVTFVHSLVVVEYTTYGHPVRQVQLPSDLRHPLHADWLPSGHLAVSHGDGADLLHRLCILNVPGDGQATVLGSIGTGNTDCDDGRRRLQLLDVRELESSATIPVEMDVPGHLAVDRRDGGRVLVADINNNRLLSISRRLQRCSVLLELAAGDEYPVRLALDEARCRLYVAYNETVRNGRWNSGRVLVFFYCPSQTV